MDPRVYEIFKKVNKKKKKKKKKALLLIKAYENSVLKLYSFLVDNDINYYLLENFD